MSDFKQLFVSGNAQIPQRFWNYRLAESYEEAAELKSKDWVESKRSYKIKNKVLYVEV
ncbi:MAG: hypothetical protein M0R17_02920 [Candidatus Omnitrophica bacterium]|jgi:hypothetical protein|nr:hypothetical protein [Candidatus Omnitrophota bacterium]